MGNYNFNKDLPVAQKTEMEVASLIESKIPNAKLKESCNNKDYDLLFDFGGLDVKLEVKEDFFAHKSGNTVIEFESRGRPSGIVTSKADYWVYKIHESDGIHFYISKTQDIKQAIDKKKWFRIVDGGDTGSGTKMFLFKLERFKEFFKKI